MAESTSVERLGAELGRPSVLARVYGLGSVFGKTFREATPVALVVGLALGGIILGGASQVAAEFDTAEARRALAQQMQLLPPLFSGLLGEPINIETLGGFTSWRVIGAIPLIVALWSISALSGTIAGEAGRGTLEVVLATPVSRRRLALEKLAAHVVAFGAAMAIAALLTWLATIVFATLPGDEATLATALAEFAYVFAMLVLFGSIAFALGPLLGRGLAAGVAAAALFGSYMVNGYAELVPGFDVLRLGSPFYWTTGHRPLAGVSDWPALGLVIGLAAAIALVGVWWFQRRDLGATVALPARIPGRRLLGAGGWSLGGAGRRAFAERLPAAIGWGAGLGMYGLVVALSAEEFARLLGALPEMGQIVERFFPGVDFRTAGGVLQLTMFNFASLMVGLAAATLVGGWAEDETERRTEMVLAAPLTRLGWALRGGGAVIAAVFVMSLVTAVGTTLGVLAMGDAIGGPISGALVLGLYGAAVAGIGLAVAGLGWPRLAGGVVAALVIGMYLLDLIGSALGLPQDVLNLALIRHLGQPMAGLYNEVGMLLCATLALGGLLGGALAFTRRDLY